MYLLLSFMRKVITYFDISIGTTPKPGLNLQKLTKYIRNYFLLSLLYGYDIINHCLVAIFLSILPWENSVIYLYECNIFCADVITKIEPQYIVLVCKKFDIYQVTFWNYTYIWHNYTYTIIHHFNWHLCNCIITFI